MNKWLADAIAVQHGLVSITPYTKRPGRRVYNFGLIDDATDFVGHLKRLGVDPYHLGKSVELRKTQDSRLPQP